MKDTTKIIIISSSVLFVSTLLIVMYYKNKNKKIGIPGVDGKSNNNPEPRMNITPEIVYNEINKVTDPEFIFFSVSQDYAITSLHQMTPQELKYVYDVCKVLQSGKILSTNENKKVVDLAAKYGIF